MKNKNEYDEEYFDKLYSISWKRKRKLIGKYERQFLGSLIPSKDDAVLDAGCGTGWYIYHYADRCQFVVGVDLGLIGLKRAVKRLKEHGSYQNVSLVLGTVQRLPFTNDYFDRILCGNVIEHLEHPSAFLRDVHRVLKKNNEEIYHRKVVDALEKLCEEVLI